jgi:hypothetical protein
MVGRYGAGISKELRYKHVRTKCEGIRTGTAASPQLTWRWMHRFGMRRIGLLIWTSRFLKPPSASFTITQPKLKRLRLEDERYVLHLDHTF